MPSQYPAPGPCVVLPENTLRCCYYWGPSNHGPVKVVGVAPNEQIVPCGPLEGMCPGCFFSDRARREHNQRKARRY